VQNLTNAYASAISLTANNDGGAVYNFIRSQTNGGTEHWRIDGAATASTMAFKTGGTERARIDAAGNFGLGVTPSAWSGFKAIDVNTISSFASATNRLQVAYNSYWNGSNYIYKTTAEAARYDMITGQHQWYTAPSGTAGNTISFTQAMTLDSGGRLLIGRTTSDANNYRIQISQGTATYGSGIQFVYEGAGAAAIWENSSGALCFGNDGADGDTQRATITSGGDLLVGQTSASNGEKFGVVSGNANSPAIYGRTTATGGYAAQFVCDNAAWVAGSMAYFQIPNKSPNTTTQLFINFTDSTAVRAEIRTNGGLANYQANNVDLSDARTKKEINPVASMWDKIGALEIVTYKYNDQTHDDVNVGVIAQQVESVEPVWVDNDGFGETPEGEEPLKTVYTKDIYFAAIKALQEAMARIEKLEAEVAALKGA
jgi:hypothetical protein